MKTNLLLPTTLALVLSRLSPTFFPPRVFAALSDLAEAAPNAKVYPLREGNNTPGYPDAYFFSIGDLVYAIDLINGLAFYAVPPLSPLLVSIRLSLGDDEEYNFRPLFDPSSSLGGENDLLPPFGFYPEASPPPTEDASPLRLSDQKIVVPIERKEARPPRVRRVSDAERREFPEAGYSLGDYTYDVDELDLVFNEEGFADVSVEVKGRRDDGSGNEIEIIVAPRSLGATPIYYLRYVATSDEGARIVNEDLPKVLTEEILFSFGFFRRTYENGKATDFFPLRKYRLTLNVVVEARDTIAAAEKFDEGLREIGSELRTRPYYSKFRNVTKDGNVLGTYRLTREEGK